MKKRDIFGVKKNVTVCTFHFPINEILQKHTRRRNSLIETRYRKCLFKVIEDTRDSVQWHQSSRKKPWSFWNFQWGRGRRAPFFWEVHVRLLQSRDEVYFLLCFIVGSEESWSANCPFQMEKELECCRQLWLALTEYVCFSASELPGACKSKV